MHIPVMLDEVLEYLNPAPGETIVDCTIGGAGHSYAIINRLIPEGRLVGIDLDIEALGEARKRLQEFTGFFILINDNFRNIHSILDAQDICEVDGLLFDLGMSSSQLANAERGFSFLRDGPLDMRMDRRDAVKGSDIVNRLSQAELKELLERYGDEHYSNRIARNIVLKRRQVPILTTQQLASVVIDAVPHRGRIHPATRTFQALRIAVNREIESLDIALQKAPLRLKRGGRVCVISYHSLEDRAAKKAFKKLKSDGVLKVITEKPVAPERDEVLKNPRARSAKMRVAERI